MPYNDGIDKIDSYSLTDFHDFDFCQFRFYVRHHLDKKYEIEEGNEKMALGSLLDQSIKKFHKAKAYGVDENYLENIVRAAARDMREEVEVAKLRGKNHFYSATIPFITEDVILKASTIFKNYYLAKDKKINRSIDDVGFCEWIIDTGSNKFKLWGGPDTLEIGEDGVAEVVDYKSRTNLELNSELTENKNTNVVQNYKSREGLNKNFDMDLMPKIYTLLSAGKLLKKGHKKARFIVKIWQEPDDESLYEEFDLEAMDGHEFLFRQRIDRIIGNKGVKFCNKPFCKACNSPKKQEYLRELINTFGLSIMSGEEFLNR